MPRFVWLAAGTVLALLVVGVVSGTLLRHLVQVTPLLAAASLARTRPAAAAYALLPLFLFWAGISILIWMFLFGVSSIANGTYSTTEIGCTVVMLICSIVGVADIVLTKKPIRRWIATTIALSFFAGQMFFMWLSFLKAVADR